MDEYYPFGLTFNSSKREESLTNKFTFQGQEKQEETGWYSFKWRNHDPAIGRFFNVDPLASSYVHNSPYAFSENKVIVHVELEGLESVFVFDQKNQPKSKGDYTAQIFVIHPNGKVGGPYLGSSYPNNSDKHNTLNQGTHLYNNKAGHKSSSKKGLNIVDGEGNRQNTSGTDPNGNPATMEWVNVHEGDSDNNRGSAGCPTCHPAHTEEFLSNFDWSAEITVVNRNGENKTYKGTTGKSSGTFTVFRGDSDKSNMMMDFILYLLNEGGDLSQKQAQSDNTRVVNDKEKLFE